jgi:2-polyprenyl-3-methyl-5-hydroxy-6-metoxy-1,4-benzoquinol methylase
VEDYYDTHEREFDDGTADLDMSALYGPFLKHVRAGGRILDAGCGGGRDSKNFIAMGFAVTAFDASDAMCRLASRRAGIHVQRLRFQDVAWQNQFDGIWACASLLHVPEAELPTVLRRLAIALAPGGALFASFKRGLGERLAADGRRFTDQTSDSVAALINGHTGLKLVRVWETADVRPDRADQHWVNLIAMDIRPLSPMP